MYNLKYTVPFMDIDGNNYTIQILEKDGLNTPVELTGGNPAFTVDVNDEDFLYTPTRFSGATLKVVGSDYLQTLFSTDYQKFKVNLIKGSTIIWTGFITPEMYSQDYDNSLFELDIECISALSTLEYIDFKSEDVTISILDLIKKCITESKGDYSGIYIPNVYSEPLSGLTISCGNFIDEDGKPENLKTCLEEVCKFLNWTVFEYNGNIYFIDVDYIKAGKTAYTKYDLAFTPTAVTLSNPVTIQNIQSKGNNNKLSILGGYNKSVIIASDYEVPDNYLFPDSDFEDGEKIKYDEYTIKEKDDKTYRYMRNWYKATDFRPYIYSFNSTTRQFTESDTLDSYNFDNPISIDSLYGCFQTSTEAFDDNEKPKDLSFEDEFLIKLSTLNETGNTNYLTATKLDETIKLQGGQPLPVITTKKYNNIVITSDSVLALNFSIAWIKQLNGIRAAVNNIADNTYNDLYDLVGGIETTKNSYYVPVSLSIGNKYYNGSDWTTTATKFNVSLEISKTTKLSWDFINVKDEFDYTSGVGLSGYKINIPTLLAGELKLIIYCPQRYYVSTAEGGAAYGQGVTRLQSFIPTHCIIKGLELNSGSPYNPLKVDIQEDTKYENVVNESYINPLDDITFKITSKNDSGLSFSKVIYNNGLLDKLTSNIDSTAHKPEEYMIKRIVDQYNQPKIKLTQIIKPDILPYSIITDSYLSGKTFLFTGGSVDYEDNRLEGSMIEIK